MKVTKEVTRIEKSAVKLTATIAKEDVAEGYKKNLATYAKNLQIPGFRKGHVPAAILEQKYGESLKMEVCGDLIDASLNQIFNEEDAKDIRPLPYSQPRLVDDKMPELDTEKDLTYTVVYDIFPKVEVKNFAGIAVKEPQVKIGDEEINNELKAIQDRNAVVIDKKDGEAVEKDNIVTIDYKELADDGSTVAGSEREGFVFTVGTGENIYKIDDEIIGMKKDETKEITKKYAKNDSDPELAGKTKKISVTVKAVKVRNLPELDDDLAQDVSEKFKTLADLKADIASTLETAKNRRIREIKNNSLLEQLVEKNPFELPVSMVQAENASRWNMLAQQFKTTPEQLEKMVTSSGQTKEDMLKQWAGDSEKMLKSRIIVDTLIREKNISVTPEEIDAEYERIAKENNITVDEVKEHYKDPRSKEYLIDDAKENKLYEELYKQVKVEKGDKTAFADLFKN
ncbi:MAG: trigger factor [Treponema sp.]|nr:trigger factor [Treponema sp.]